MKSNTLNKLERIHKICYFQGVERNENAKTCEILSPRSLFKNPPLEYCGALLPILLLCLGILWSHREKSPSNIPKQSCKNCDYNTRQQSWDTSHFLYSATNFHPPLPLKQCWFSGEVPAIMEKFRVHANFKCPTSEPALF